MLNWNKYTITKILVITIIILSLVTISGKEPVRAKEPTNIIFDQDTNTLQLSSLTLKQKIAQMIIVYGKESNREFYQNMLIGCFYVDTKNNKEEVVKSIDKCQEKATIPFFVTVDFEGCINPFEEFYPLPPLTEIETKEEAYQIGLEAGQLLQEMHINMNFAPVVDLEDNILFCRNFVGTPEEISKKAESYIQGLEEQGVMAVAKHYPGKTLTGNDLHLSQAKANINDNDLLPFKRSMSKGVTGIMVSHTIVEGSLNSNLKPAVLSPEIIDQAKDQFTGMIISDEIGMLGLATYYPPKEVNNLFVDLFKAGSDLFLNFDRSTLNIKRMINAVEYGVISGKISETRIDQSVTKILEAKGITVVP